MGTFEDYLERAKDLAEDAGEIAKKAAGEAVDRVKELTEEGSKAREMVKNAKEESAALAFGAKKKVEGMIQDARAIKEIKQGIIELEGLPEFEGSIIYSMELEAMKNDLNALMLFIGDGRLDDASVVEEIKKVMGKVKPAPFVQAEADGQQTPQPTEEEQAIEKVKAIAYDACVRALATMNVSAE